MRLARLLASTLLLVTVPARAAEADAPTPPAPALQTRATAEVSVGQSSSTGGAPTSFLAQRAGVLREVTPWLSVGLDARLTEYLAASTSPSGAAPYRSGASSVLALGGLVALEPAEHWAITLGAQGSPSSGRDVATTADDGAASGAGAALVRATTSSAGGYAELAWDSFSTEASHDLDLEVVAGAAATRYASQQRVLEGTGAGASAAADLRQGRASLSATLTIHDDTDVGVEATGYVYDAADPGRVGTFDVSSRTASTTSFGTGMPMMPARWTIQPEIAERFGRFGVRAGYQLSELAIDGASLSHAWRARVQVGLGAVKLSAGGAFRRDTVASAATDTWMASLGATLRF